MSSENSRSTDIDVQTVLHHDFCPWANRYVYWLKKPIGWLFTAAATAALLGIYVASQALAVSAAVVGLIVLGMIWPAVAMKGITGKLTWQRHRSVEGEPIETVLEVTNRWPWPVWGLMVESDAEVVNNGAKDSSGHSKSVALACLKPFSTTQFVWDSKPTKRGVYPDKESFLATGFPFGIWTARSPLAVPNSLTVWPESIDLHDMPNLSGDHRSIVGAWIDKAGHEGDVIGVRPFRDGDSLRNVHWAQSAKSDNLIVCERQSVARRSIRLNIDHLPDSRQRENEWLIRIGGTIAKTFLAHQWSVELEIDGKIVSAEPGERGLRSVMDMLATFDSVPTTSGIARGISSDLQHGIEGVMKVPEEVNLIGKVPVANRSQQLQKRSTAGTIGNSIHRKRKPTQSDRLEIVVTSCDRIAHLKPDQRTTNLNTGWILIEDRVSATNSDSDVNPWMHIQLSDPVWPQIQAQWMRVCHANASMVRS